MNNQGQGSKYPFGETAFLRRGIPQQESVVCSEYYYSVELHLKLTHLG